MLTLRINLLFTWNSNLTGRPLFLLFICFFLWIWQHQITGTSELSCAWHRDFWGPCVVWNASEGGQVWVYTTRDRGLLGIKWWLNRWLRTWPLPPVTVWNLGTQSPVWYGRGRSFQSFWCWISFWFCLLRWNIQVTINLLPRILKSHVPCTPESVNHESFFGMIQKQEQRNLELQNLGD